MKKLVAIILAIVMVIPVVATAADRDPIVGCWYFFYSAKETPEMAANFPGYDEMISVYYFTEDGVIMCLELDMQNTQGTPTYIASGKWSKNGDRYTYSIVGLNGSDAFIEDNNLYMFVQDRIYLKVRHMDFYNPYEDYIYR